FRGALLLADQRRCEGNVRTRAQPEAKTTLAADRRTRRRILTEHVAGRHLHVRTLAFVDAHQQVEVRGFARRLFNRLADGVGQSPLTGSAGDAHTNAGEEEEGARKEPGQQHDLADVPHSGLEGHEQRTMVLRTLQHGPEEGLQSFAKCPRVVHAWAGEYGWLRE